jgi:hypothetical protein
MTMLDEQVAASIVLATRRNFRDRRHGNEFDFSRKPFPAREGFT